MARVKLIMTATMEVGVNTDEIFDLDEFGENEKPTLEGAIKVVIDSYLETPEDFVIEDGNEVKIGIKYEIVED